MSTQQLQREQLWGHPKGLYVLFFTEMWERFSYYGMRAILTLYLISSATGDNPGLGWEKEDALSLYGTYTMMVYLMSIPGGIIADKLLGQKKSVLYGGLLLCLGHGILAIEEIWAFYTGLVLIVVGVGGLKPNISTMVGGLYPAGDIRRDKGFTIFYIGINVGAFLSSLIVGYVGEKIGWHYGFGLAGIGMLLGQAVFMMGQKHLKGIGDFLGKSENPEQKAVMKQPLSDVEKDRMKVLLLSFLIIIVFWGAFEQAGGLMNIYALEKIDRTIAGIEIPASVFQSVNAGFIMLFGTTVAWFWARRKLKSKEASSLFKMAIGTIIMGLGFLFMTAAAIETETVESGKAMMIWLVLAYLFHTIGELCASPVALSFITKLAPVKYASLMMGAYFAATGLGNKVAGIIGESSQMELAKFSITELTPEAKTSFYNLADLADSTVSQAENFRFKGNIYLDEGELRLTDFDNNSVLQYLELSEENRAILKETIEEKNPNEDQPYTFKAELGNEVDKAEMDKDEAHTGKVSNYEGKFTVVEVANAKEKKTFNLITIITGLFGIVLILFLKPLKRLTHGVEEAEK